MKKSSRSTATARTTKIREEEVSGGGGAGEGGGGRGGIGRTGIRTKLRKETNKVLEVVEMPRDDRTTALVSEVSVLRGIHENLANALAHVQRR